MLRSVQRVTVMFAVVVVLTLLAARPALADTMTYTNETTFTAQLKPGYYLEDFSAYNYYGYLPGPVSFSGNGYGYEASSPSGLYAVKAEGASYPPVGQGALSTLNAPDPLLFFDFTGSGKAVTAVGGYFFTTEFFGSFTPAKVTVTLNDGTTKEIDQTGPSLTFLGFTSTMPIQSLEIRPPVGSGLLYATADHLYVGSVIPEPSVLVRWAGLVVMGFVMVLYRRFKCRGSP